MNSVGVLKLGGIVVTILLMLGACTDKVGAWDDNIELSQKEFSFSSSADSVLVTTNGEGWWISSVSLDEEYVDIESIVTTVPVFEIIAAEFVLARKSATVLHIVISENPTSEARELLVGLQSGNYFDSIRVIQQGQ